MGLGWWGMSHFLYAGLNGQWSCRTVAGPDAFLWTLLGGAEVPAWKVPVPLLPLQRPLAQGNEYSCLYRPQLFGAKCLFLACCAAGLAAACRTLFLVLLLPGPGQMVRDPTPPPAPSGWLGRVRSGAPLHRGPCRARECSSECDNLHIAAD